MENTTLKTQGGHEVILKNFINGYDKDAIDGAILDNMELPISARIAAAKKKAYELLIVSVDGKTENVFDEAQKLDHKDAAEIKAAIDSITEDSKKV